MHVHISNEGGKHTVGAYLNVLSDHVVVTRDTPVGQRQDSTADQLRDVVKVANQMGCYDAADAISRVLLSYR